MKEMFFAGVQHAFPNWRLHTPILWCSAHYGHLLWMSFLVLEPLVFKLGVFKTNADSLMNSCGGDGCVWYNK